MSSIDETPQQKTVKSLQRDCVSISEEVSQGVSNAGYTLKDFPKYVNDDIEKYICQ